MTSNNIIFTTIDKQSLSTFNNLSITYKVDEINNLLIAVKTLFNVDYKLMKVRENCDKETNNISVSKRIINEDLIPLRGAINIFHTREDNAFISYEKFNQQIIKVNYITNAELSSKPVICIQKKEKIGLINIKDCEATYYLEYNFNLDDNINLKILDYFNSAAKFLVLDVNFNEIVKISSDKIEKIQHIFESLNILLNN